MADTSSNSARPAMPQPELRQLAIVVNGVPRMIDAEATLANLLAELKVASPQVAVEVNLELVPRAQHAGHRLRDGDQVEIVTLAGGG